MKPDRRVRPPGPKLAALLAPVVLAAGCVKPGTPSGAASGADEKGRHVSSAQASTTIVSADEAIAIEELLARADRQLEEEDYDGAARSYEFALEHAVLDANRLRALLGWGTALDLGAHPKAALRAYSRYVAESPKGARRDDVAVRQIRLLVYLERYEEAGRASRVIDVADRTPLQQVALLSARAHLDLAEGRLDDAARTISKGRAIVDAHGLDRVAVPPLDVASLFFALGELRAGRAKEINFDPLPANFAQELERRCQLILDAQSAYSEAMRSKDAHWSSMSGVKVGQLYKALHADLMAIPAPEAAVSDEKKQLFEGAMRLRYSILLKKSLSMMEATVTLLESAPHKSPWRERAREALLEIRAEQKAEEAAINSLPYSRAQLQQVLDEMADKARSRDAAPGGS